MIGGGSILTVIAVVLISQLTGVDLTSMLGAQQQTGTTTSTASSIDTSVCTSGDSANKYTQCRMVATAESLDAVWTEQLPAQAGLKYAKPEFVLWDGTQISSACGNASSAVGPFYCSGDQTVYLDMSFFSEMERSLGAADTPLAEEYIVAHEFGHHIQHLTGQMAKADRSGSGATSDSVRLELQADCYAGVWMHWASTTPDPSTGTPYLQTPTADQIMGALQTAEAIGDDRLQTKYQGTTNSESWTHGSAQQRATWLQTGLDSGSIATCNTWDVPRV